MKHKTKQLDFNGQQIFLGLDVHDRQWTIVILVSDMTKIRTL